MRVLEYGPVLIPPVLLRGQPGGTASGRGDRGQRSAAFRTRAAQSRFFYLVSLVKNSITTFQQDVIEEFLRGN